MNHPATLRAMRANGPHAGLRLEEMPIRPLGEHEVLIKVSACGICRTDLHVLDGELPNARYPVTPGHEIVGRIAEMGSAVKDRALGERVGVPWLGWTCGQCPECRRGLENL